MPEIQNDVFLNYSGLQSYDDKIKNYIDDKMTQLLEDISELTKKDVDDLLDIIEDDEDTP